MTSATSSSKFISMSLVKEDFRRYWSIPVLATLFYFISGIFYILVNYSEITSEEGSYMVSIIDQMLSGQYFCYVLLECIVPIISTVLVFKYLHNSGHVMSVHAQPFTRSQLLNSHALSCLLFSLIPVLITGIILLCIAAPAYYPTAMDYTYVNPEDVTNLFTRGRILGWMADTSVDTVFIMAIAIMGGMITGTSLHHAIAAMGFNIVLPAIALIFTGYCDIYLFGYITPQSVENLISALSPIGWQMKNAGLSIVSCLVYLAVSILLLALCHMLYKKRKLERATEGVVFEAFSVIITLIFGFLGMTAGGFAFYYSFDHSMKLTVLGYVLGAVLGMIIIRMIILKTFKIFDKKSLIIMASFLVAGGIFVSGLSMDFTGYERRIPAQSQAAGLSISADIFDGVDGLNYSTLNVSDPESIEQVKAIHKLILDHKNEIEPLYYDSDSYYDYNDTANIFITYYGTGEDPNAENGKFQRRYVNVPMYLIIHSDEFKALFNNPEIRKQMEDTIPPSEKLIRADIESSAYSLANSDYGSGYGSASVVDKDDVESLKEAIRKDVQNLTVEDVIDDYNTLTYCNVTLVYRETRDKNSGMDPYVLRTYTSGNTTVEEVMNVAEITDGSDEIAGDLADNPTEADYYSYNVGATFKVTKAFKNTIQWLQDHGYGNFTTIDTSNWDFAVVSKLEGEDGENATNLRERFSGYIEGIPESTETSKVITDPESIYQMALDSVSHIKYGNPRTITTADSGAYFIEFYSIDENDVNEDGLVYSFNQYAAYIDGKNVK